MRKPIHLFAGIIATLAVMLTVTLYLTASEGTKKAVSENIPHGQNEKPISK